MITFWETNYRADRMSLSLVAPQSLNELERLARASFSRLLPPTRAGVGTPTPADAEYRDAPLPFGPMRPPRMLAVRPANYTVSRGLFVSWCLSVDSAEKWRRLNLQELWGLLLMCVLPRALGPLPPTPTP